ncbi:MAG TPA: hypothetical protein VFW94_04905 [Candidatus Acidoferrales bacterium]|nr:hypothetical protein [Candidatus Acidoferrales bacterium]
MKSAGFSSLRSSACFVVFLLVGTCLACTTVAAQDGATPSRLDESARIAALDKSLSETRAELTETRAEIRQLRALLEAMNKKISGSSSETTPDNSQAAAPTEAAAPVSQSSQPGPPSAKISQDDWQVLKAEVEAHEQEKVESGSKYRLKLWGLALFNAFDVNGRVDNLDVPTMALSRSAGTAPGSLGASFRQSIFGITGTGPDLFGWRTSADLQIDFFGGLPSGYGGGSSGLLRLRLARIRFDRDRTSIVAGLDTPFFSPETPTSFMSLAVPAFATSGNLWNWSPTIRVERRFDTGSSQWKVEAGVLAPSEYATATSGVRQPTPGEASRQPVYAVRVSANGTHGDRPSTVGVSAIYFPQRFLGGAFVSGWGSVADWRVPLLWHTEFSGEFFAGRGLDSFGGVPVPLIQSQVYAQYAESAEPAITRAMMLGGWSQLKFVVNAQNEFNVAVGAGNRDSDDIARAAVLFPALNYLSPRNQTILVNYIFRPRSDLLFSPEYRRLRTYSLTGAPVKASQVGLAAGFIF